MSGGDKHDRDAWRALLDSPDWATLVQHPVLQQPLQLPPVSSMAWDPDDSFDAKAAARAAAEANGLEYDSDSEEAVDPDIVSLTDPQIDAMSNGQLVEVAGRVVASLRGCHPQAHLNHGSACWIVKPGGKSRGRGIKLFNDMTKLLQYVGEWQGGRLL